MAFSPDGRVAAVVGDDSTGLLWDVTALAGSARPKPVTLTKTQLETEWAALLADDAGRAYRAAVALAAAPGQAVPLLKDYLGKGRAPDAERVARLIADLDADDFATREQATEELTRLGDAAEGALRKALGGKLSAEQRRRVESVLAKLGAPGDTGERLGQGRALELLERIGDEEARSVLKALTGGASDARLTQEAKAALQQLEKWLPAKP
jgi:hypothetical protein